MTKRLIYIICLISLPGFLSAQNLTDVTVSGLVANKSTGQGVSGVLVEVINEADTTQRSVVITDAAGRYTANLSGVVTGVAVEFERMPLEFRLEQNYPNPFNPSTAIVFHVPEPSEVALVIYNTLGQKVRTLVNQKYSPGVYTAVWDAVSDLGRGVSAGIYFYQLQVKNRVQTRKMLLLDGFAGGYSLLRGGTRTEGRSESLSKTSEGLQITVRSRGARIEPFQQNHISVTEDDFQYDIDVDVIIDEGLNPDLIAVSEPDEDSKVFISGMSNAVIGSLDGSESVTIANLRTGAEVTTSVEDDRSIALKVLDGQIGDAISMTLFRSGNQVEESRLFQILGDKPPVVTTTKPTNGEKDIVIGTRIYIHFSEPIDPSTLNQNSFNVSDDNGVISGSIELEEGNAVAVFTPQQPLSPNTAYSITVTTEVQDLQGLSLQYGFSSGFATGASVQTRYEFTRITRNTHSRGDASGVAIASDGTVFTVEADRLNAFQYDGTTFTNTASIGIDHYVHGVVDLTAGPDGTLFLAEKESGLFAFSYDGKSLINTAHIDDTPENDYNSLGSDRGIAVASDGTVFLANGDDGLRAYRYDGSSFINTAHINDGGHARGVALARDGTVFLIASKSSGDGGLWAYDYDGTSFTQTAHIDNIGRAVAIGPDGTIFTTGYSSLWAYVYDGTSLNNTAQIDDEGLDLVVAEDGTIFTTSHAIQWYRSPTLQAYHYNGAAFTMIEQIGDGGDAIGITAEGTVILANTDEGLHAYNYDGTSFSNTTHNTRYGTAMSVTVASDGTVFLANGGGGLWAYDYDGAALTSMAHINDGGEAREVAVSTDGTVFLANWDDGLRAYSYDGVSFTNTAYTSNENRRATGVAVGPDGTIFLTSGGSELRAYNYNGMAFSLTAHIKDGGNDISDLAIADDGIIFLLNGSGGLRAYSYDGMSFTNIAHLQQGGGYLAVSNNSSVFLTSGDDLLAYEFDGSSFTFTANVDKGQSANGVAIGVDGTVFLANGGDGLRAYKYSGTAFSLSAHIKDGGGAQELAVAVDGTVFLAKGSRGLVVYKYSAQ